MSLKDLIQNNKKPTVDENGKPTGKPKMMFQGQLLEIQQLPKSFEDFLEKNAHSMTK